MMDNELISAISAINDNLYKLTKDEIENKFTSLFKDFELSNRQKREISQIKDSILFNYYNINICQSYGQFDILSLNNFASTIRRDHFTNFSLKLKLKIKSEELCEITLVYVTGLKLSSSVSVSSPFLICELSGLKSIIVRYGYELFFYNITFTKIDHIMIGIDGYLFLQNDRNNSLRHNLSLLEVDRDNIKKYEIFFNRLNKLNIKLCFILAPNKERVFNNFYPYHIPDDNKAVNQLKTIAEGNSIPFHYPVHSLINNYSAFSKTDTHWTYLGAWTILHSILNKYGFKIPFDYFCFTEATSIGDLGSKIFPPVSSQIFYAEGNPKYKYKFLNNPPQITNFLPQEGGLHKFFNENAIFKNKIVVFGDSFSRYFYIFLNNLFSEVTCLRTSASLILDIINFEKPDFIIFERAERFLYSAPDVFQNLSDCKMMFRPFKINIEDFNNFVNLPFYGNYFKEFLTSNF